MCKKVLLVGSQHGDELLGIRLYEFLKINKPKLLDSIDYILANPEAYKKGIRLINSDMNRSFNNNNVDEYEKDMTKNLLNQIYGGGYDYVLDLHTTTTRVGCCMLVSELNEVTRRVVNAAPGIDNIIKLPNEITQNSLIGVVKNAVSVECYQPLSDSREVLTMLAAMVENLIVNVGLEQRTVNIFEVDEYITEAQSEYARKNNFEEYNGKYPILVGGKSGRTYTGFLASKKVRTRFPLL